MNNEQSPLVLLMHHSHHNILLFLRGILGFSLLEHILFILILKHDLI